MLDNFEQLTAGAGGVLAGAARRVRVGLFAARDQPRAVASRGRAAVRAWPVLSDHDATELFVCTRSCRRPGGADIDSVLALRAVRRGLTACRSRSSLPPRRSRALSVKQRCSTAWTGRLAVADSRVRVTRPRRQRTLRATIDWSYELLNDDEQRLFARLAVFSGGCALPAVEAECGAELDELQALVDRSLVCSDGERTGCWRRSANTGSSGSMAPSRRTRAARRGARRVVRPSCLSDAEASTRHAPAAPRLRPAGCHWRARTFRSAVEWRPRQAATPELRWPGSASPLTRITCGSSRANSTEDERWLRLAREQLPSYPLLLQAHVLGAARDVAVLRGEYDQAAATL